MQDLLDKLSKRFSKIFAKNKKLHAINEVVFKRHEILRDKAEYEQKPNIIARYRLAWKLEELNMAIKNLTRITKGI